MMRKNDAQSEIDNQQSEISDPQFYNEPKN